MLIKTFDQGWGNDWPIKKFEQNIVNQLLKTMLTDNSNTVLINSTWYSQEYHQSVLEQLRNLKIDQLVLVAMLDPAIPKIDWYKEFDCKKFLIGYYLESKIDFWALSCYHFFNTPSTDLLTSVDNMDLAYMCLNRKPHWHRKKLYARLESMNLLDHGLVSMGGIRSLSESIDDLPLTPNSGVDSYGIVNDISSLGSTLNWQRCFLNIVTETVYDVETEYFVSEKIYKPIIGCRPFLVYAPGGAQTWLNSRGFETFCNDFGDISDLDLSQPNNLPKFVQTLCQQPRSYWTAKYLALKDKILYNKNHFQTYINQQTQIIEKGIQCQI